MNGFKRKIRILKKNQVQTGTSVVLPCSRTAGAEPFRKQGDSSQSGAAQARIVESNSDYVILEVICGCGQKSFIQCNYGNVAGSPAQQEIRS
ncbi:MAG TPA: hypothetical protein PK054_10220 [Anaerohalosphaeraceae bacterium]|nr:hypothetical protein [Anaerohalosphaeraceae bacterium]HOL88483.1 hypothetical protein [Anaerohalosphaeraceae bacterium]HPP56940.1 hypothetical protein [Anaerohalosphaeraceae bacterium]